jgi:hypothetical protein
MIRERKISARAASIRAGWGGKPKKHRPDYLKPPKLDVKALIG